MSAVTEISFLWWPNLPNQPFFPIRSRRRRPPRQRLRCVLSMFSSIRVKVPTQPDGGEGLEMMQGYRREAGSERSMDQMCESMDKNRIQGASVGRAGNLPQSPWLRSRHCFAAISIKDAKRRFGGCAQKATELTSGDLLCVASATETAERWFAAGQKSAEGILGYAVGKASEALQCPKTESTR